MRLTLKLTRVTIPLWFDSNKYSHTVGAISVFVTIPLWFDSNPGNLLKKINTVFSHNSTMVRFKPPHEGPGYGAWRWVTIPLWFDSNRLQESCDILRLNGSQFHYGSIQTGQSLQPISESKHCHNSTMVRFKLNKILTSLRAEDVTIPLWFDSNRDRDGKYNKKGPGSQFHYGSIQTAIEMANIIKKVQGHNSTMVRFKRLRQKLIH